MFASYSYEYEYSINQTVRANIVNGYENSPFQVRAGGSLGRRRTSGHQDRPRKRLFVTRAVLATRRVLFRVG